VVVRSVGASQNTKLTHPVHDRRGIRRRRRARAAVLNELNADEQTRAADVANELVARLKSAKFSKQLAPDSQRVHLKFLVDRCTQRREPRRAGRGTSAERAEELHPVVEAVGNRT